MRFFKRKYIGTHGVTGWRVEHWQRALDRYKSHFDAIRSRLPKEVIEFHKISFHDLVIRDMEWIAPKQLRMDVDWLQLFFLDVSSSELPKELVGTAWLYSEVESAGAGEFELSVLLDGGEEFRVRAKNISIYHAYKRKWIIGGIPGYPP